ncbi:MAG: hypothetical protein ABIC57_02975 [bacterium]
MITFSFVSIMLLMISSDDKGKETDYRVKEKALLMVVTNILVGYWSALFLEYAVYILSKK